MSMLRTRNGFFDWERFAFNTDWYSGQAPGYIHLPIQWKSIMVVNLAVPSYIHNIPLFLPILYHKNPIPLHPIPVIHFNIIIPSTMYGYPKWSLSWGFHKTLLCIFHSYSACYIPCSSPLYDNTNNIRWIVQITKFLVMNFPSHPSTFFCYFLFRSKCSIRMSVS